MSGSTHLPLILGVAMLCPPVVGYWLARPAPSRVRRGAVVLFASLPLLILLGGMLAPPWTPDRFGWWIVTLLIFSPAVLIWAALVWIGYFVGRKRRR